MKHTSIKMNTPCEFVNITQINPLISKCQIKVCYVSDEPNRNKSVITKETAQKLAVSLPGSPIVGYYDDKKQDFDTHTKELEIIDGKISISDKTRPYGFVDLNAKVWFQKFLDDEVNEREYLMTEGYLWTGQYPECNRVITKGNNQSMELCKDEKFLNAHWAKDDSGEPLFFIINEALISKLCILGEDCEPCFEGAQISKVEFSFEDGFKEAFSNMIFQLKEILDKGGFEKMPKNDKEFDFEKKKKDEEEAVAAADKKDEKTTSTDEKASDENQKEDDTREEENKKKKTQYDLEEVVEYVELQQQYAELETKYNETVSKYNNLQDEIKQLSEFKSTVEKKQKEDMIASFYMLSDADKADVVAHIDEYSLDEIEGKLAVICVRNKVNFNLEKETKTEEVKPLSYNLEDSVETVPAWVRAVQTTKKEKNL